MLVPSSAIAQPTQPRRILTTRTRKTLGPSPTLAFGGSAAWKVKLVVKLVVCAYIFIQRCVHALMLWGSSVYVFFSHALEGLVEVAILVIQIRTDINRCSLPCKHTAPQLWYFP